MDATLYPAENGLWPKIGENIESFLRFEMGVPAAEVRPLKTHYYQQYGTTLRGLQEHFQIDPFNYLAKVHDIDVNAYLVSDPGLRAMLASLAVPAWVFTNSDSVYGGRVLQTLGIEDCFAGVIDIVRLGFECKPNKLAFERALAIAGETDPTRVVFLEDSLRNLIVAREMGITGVLVGPGPQEEDGFPRIRRPHDLPVLMPELFKR